VLQDTFNQFWANYGVKERSYHKRNATSVHVVPPIGVASVPSSTTADSGAASDGNTAAAVVDDGVQQPAVGNASVHENFLFKLTNHWWPEFGQRYEAADASAEAETDDSGEREDGRNEGRPTRLDIQALFSHEGFINFYKANANVIASVWNYLKFNFTLLLGWLLNTLWYTPLDMARRIRTRMPCTQPDAHAMTRCTCTQRTRTSMPCTQRQTHYCMLTSLSIQVDESTSLQLPLLSHSVLHHSLLSSRGLRRPRQLHPLQVVSLHLSKGARQPRLSCMPHLQPKLNMLLLLRRQDGGTRVMVQEAITQAINEVFLSLVKISIFHALWTWLTLTILGVRIVYISTFLTLLFVIFPVIGTRALPTTRRVDPCTLSHRLFFFFFGTGPYWVSLPACLELWLVGKPVHAVVLFCLHMAAAWYIDPKIYSEVTDLNPPLQACDVHRVC
jgi:hypothetical protein